MADTMKALRKIRPEVGGEIQEIAIPEVKPGFVLVKVEMAAICGSDLHVYDWREDVAGSVSLPLTMGHEYCGTVVAVGEHVHNVAAGDRVVGETHYPCGRCYMCKTGNQHICVHVKIVGRSLQGCFAEYILVPEICVVKVPDSTDARLGAIYEPLGVAIHALQKTNCGGKSVAVLGCGPIGLMTVTLAKRLGATRVLATSRTGAKLESARQMGADFAFNPKEVDIVEAVQEVTGGNGVDIAIEASGSREAFIQALEILKRNGHFCLLGTPEQPVIFDSKKYLITKELNISGIWGRRMFETWLLLENLIAGGRLELTPFLGEVYPLEKFEEAFAKASSGTIQRIFLAP